MSLIQESCRVLVVDDERNIRRTLRMILEGEDFVVEEAASAEEGLEIIGKGQINAVLMDVKLPGMDGITALKNAMGIPSAPPVIMISGHATIKDAVEAVKIGAYDFLEKPLDRDRVIISIKRCLERAALERQVRDLTGASDMMVGDGAAMRRLKEDIHKVAPTGGRVFITGESGTGKELVARGIHVFSARAKGPFIKVNCAAIPSELIESELFGYEKGAFSGATQRKKGMVELADKGTLFLDEIGDMGPAAQAKVLRVLQTGELSRLGSEDIIKVDVRIVAATNKDIMAEIAAGRFRDDLYYRLNVVPLHVPPLRERSEDIPLLVEHFLEEYSVQNGTKRKHMSGDAMGMLVRHQWPGNIREMKNLIERLVIMTGPGKPSIELGDIPDYIGRPATGSHPPQAASSLNMAPAVVVPQDPQQGSPDDGSRSLKEFKSDVERERILGALEANDWNVSRTAAALGIERTNLHKKIKAHGLVRR